MKFALVYSRFSKSKTKLNLSLREYPFKIEAYDSRMNVWVGVLSS